MSSVIISDDIMTPELKYKYEPLTKPDSIRLIKLQPAIDASSILQCGLINMPLSACDGSDIFGHYIALSYVWGCPKKNRTSWVDRTTLEITENLYSALHDLRDETRAFLLWADGISINQSDIEEKAMQIQMMGQIYAGAPHTIIYFGPANGESPETLCLEAIRNGSNADADVLLGYLC
jgi:hypothetical protein